jgi:putative RNA 2'-phosphotransferase
MDKNTEIKFSKLLSLLLRHKPEEIGLTLDAEGWADVNELLERLRKTGKTRSKDDLRQVVASNDKKRFSFNDDETKIRANQGHSLKNVDLRMQPQEPPAVLFHGTAERFLKSIMETGIDKRSRQHVHLSKDKVTAQAVGSRHGKAIILTIAAKQMYDDGLHFYLSDNSVWLTDFVDVKYIEVGDKS